MSENETLTMKPASEEEVREALYDVVDPELGIDVVNLGLIYGIHIDDANIATIDMTLTSAACPLTDVIEDQAKSATDGIVNELRINWVWMRRGARTRSRTTGVSSFGRSGSTSESAHTCAHVCGPRQFAGGHRCSCAQDQPSTTRNAESARKSRLLSSLSRRSWKLRWRR